jgi:hypothetical protein
MKQLPWFKFSPADWMMGRISRQSCEVQVAFLRLCCIYWNAECVMTYEHAELEADGYLEKLIALKMVEVYDDGIGIKFLDIQFSEGKQKREKMSNAGKVSAERRMNKMATNVQHSLNESSIEKRREEKSRIREDKSVGTYTREDFCNDLLGDFKTDENLREVTMMWLKRKKVITKQSMLISKKEIAGHSPAEMYTAIMSAAEKNWAQLYGRKEKQAKGTSTSLPAGKPWLDPATIAAAERSTKRLEALANPSPDMPF